MWEIVATEASCSVVTSRQTFVRRRQRGALMPRCTLVRKLAETRAQALVSGSLQSLFKIAEQVVLIDWLTQEGNRSGLHRACPHVFIRMARDENNGDAMPLGDQQVLQVKAA